MLDMAELDPFRPRRGRALHEEEVPGGAIGITLHNHCAVRQMRQQYRSDIGVILKQVAFGDSQLGPECLPEVGELYDLPFHFQFKAGLFTIRETWTGAWNNGGRAQAPYISIGSNWVSTYFALSESKGHRINIRPNGNIHSTERW